MTVAAITLTATNQAYQGQGKPYVAKILRLDSKTNYERSFLPRTALVTEPGLYEVCDYDKKDRKDVGICAVVELDGQLVKSLWLKPETVAEIIQSGKSVAQIAPYRDADGKVQIRRDGKLMWRNSTNELRAERERLIARLAEIDAALATE